MAATQLGSRQVRSARVQLSSDPASPSSGYSDIYPKTDGKWYIKNSDGTVTEITNRITGSTPTQVAGTGAGTSPTISITGNDIAGYITILTGTTPSASAIISTISFSATLPNTPKAILITAGNTFAGGALTRFFIDQATLSTTSFVLRSTGTALAAATTYILYYYVQ